ncbi:sprouty-related, EVH1 domain-containing protein 1 isoform X1 [Spodoptera frugiperda]|uniref:Sprouty-related, EVH1 domain-containing protein 1 isoform X1 n=1 Tax=Spodoptera frugiperda TaxID=7108 RepID=A0A9R0DFQ0_SPOFR|nr:sprouty-related, EVH1 domain-containing protein 1 isoform X1 [Spodoptera frugiperda]
MTEASENAYLVRVRAQVMCRDEGTGGWVALGGGGLADVMVGKRARAHRASAGGESNGEMAVPGTSTSTVVAAVAPTHEYFIHGKRISDGLEVLECTIKKDFQYNKVMPTFHHWVTDEKRFGLTFQTAADARAFDKGVRTAIEELLDGLGGAWPSLHAYKKHNPAPKEEDEESNIFECLNLPCESRSSSENSTASRRRPPDDITQTPILSAITLPRHPLSDSLTQYETQFDETVHAVEEPEIERCPYVHLSAVHEYTYPAVSASATISSEMSSPNTKPPLLKRDSGSMKKGGSGGYNSGPPPLPDKKPAEATFQARIKCRHCHEWYLESANRAGACEFAPDCFRSCIDCVSCIKCAQCMLYHCMADAEGDFALHPCACAPPDEACAKRWMGVSLLSVLVPCLWCYPPLRCLHAAARLAHSAGGMHAPAHPHVAPA